MLRVGRIARAVAGLVTVVGVLIAGAPGVAAADPGTVPMRIGGLRIDRLGTSGSPVVLIPGLLSGPWAFGDAARLLARDHVVYQVTLPGFDGVPADPSADRVGDAARALGDLVAAIGEPKPLLVGHSVGGTVALRVAAQHPVRGVVAVDGLPVFPGMEKLPPAQRVPVADRAAGLLAAARTPEARQRYALDYLRTTGVRTPGLAEKYAPFMATSDFDAGAGYLRGDLTLDDRPLLPRITAPVLEIVPFDPDQPPRDETGAALTQDRVVAYYRSLLGGVTRLQVEPAAPSRHFVMLDASTRFLDLTRGFLAAHG